MSKSHKLIVNTFIFGALASAAVIAQASERPNLEGIWTNASLTGLQRPEGVEQLVVDAQQAQIIAANTPIAGLDEVDAPDSGTGQAPPAGSFDFGLRGYNEFWIDPGSTLARVRGEYRTSYVIDPPDGRVPRLANPRGDFQARSFGARYVTGVGDASGPEALPLAERCLLGFGNTGGPGMMGVLYNSTYQFVQTDDYVMIMVEMNGDARIVPIHESAEEARANLRPVEWQQWFGDTRGWYENGELVMETVNVRPDQMAESSIRITPEGRIIERFSRYSETEIVYQFTVEDDNLYSQPWTAELSFHATDGPIYEYACHEGNYAMPGILAGARMLEAQEAASQ